jgi:hypothetical protein
MKRLWRSGRPGLCIPEANMEANELLRELDILGSDLADFERRVRAARARWDRVRRALRATPTVRRRRQSVAGQSKVSAMEAPGHVIDTVAAIPRGGGRIDARTLARLLKVTPAVAGTRLQRAAKLGLVRRVGRGQYAAST